MTAGSWLAVMFGEGARGKRSFEGAANWMYTASPARTTTTRRTRRSRNLTIFFTRDGSSPNEEP
jgi:hypothetical protein